MNNTRKERQLPVARVRPGDYQLRSPESRAAARALLEAREETTINVQIILGVSHPYATLIKRGLKIPHLRHWKTAKLAGVVTSGVPAFGVGRGLRKSADFHFTAKTRATVWSGFVEDADFAVTMRL